MTGTEKPCLFLHIGHPKAGSTTLQAFLFKNWPLLQEHGFAVPTSNFGVAGASQDPGNILQSLEAMRKAGDITPLKRWITAVLSGPKPARKLIISSENLFLPAWPALFEGLAGMVDIKLVYYLRRQDQLFPSAWRQWGLKRGLSLDELIKRRIAKQQPDYRGTITAWLETGLITAQHIRFNSPTFLEDGSLTTDFCRYIGLDPARCQPVTDQNTSVDMRLLLFLSQHPALFDSPDDDTVITLLQGQAIAPIIPLHIDSAQFQAIKTAFEPSNQALLKLYHPSHAGITVIGRETARISDTHISDTEQRAYVLKCLKHLPDTSHPRLQQLAQIIGGNHA